MDQSSRKKNEDGGATLRPVQIYKKMICIGTNKYVAVNGFVQQVNLINVKRGNPTIDPSYSINTIKKYGAIGVTTKWALNMTPIETLDKVWFNEKDMTIAISSKQLVKIYLVNVKKEWPFKLQSWYNIGEIND